MRRGRRTGSHPASNASRYGVVLSDAIGGGLFCAGILAEHSTTMKSRQLDGCFRVSVVAAMWSVKNERAVQSNVCNCGMCAKLHLGGAVIRADKSNSCSNLGELWQTGHGSRIGAITATVAESVLFVRNVAIAPTAVVLVGRRDMCA